MESAAILLCLPMKSAAVLLCYRVVARRGRERIEVGSLKDQVKLTLIFPHNRSERAK